MNSRRTTPRSSKFSDLKGLGRRSGEEPSIPPAASPLVVDTRPTVRNFSRKQDNESFMEDADVKISRHRYAKIVAQMAERARKCNSVGVFVESMLRELRLQDVDEATLAAAATWALNLLSSQSVGGALPAILEALLPVIYCQYDQEKLSYPPPAIQVQLRQDDAVQYNPYFTHSMFVEQVRVDHSKVSHLSEAVHNALKANENRRDYVLRTIDENRIRVLRTTLKMWRSHVRRLRILAVTSENRLRRHTAENSNLRLQASFYHWKVLLELSRNNFLTERLHEAAFQLENAKNQFQLQCYRADRLIQTTKKAKEELQLALEENDDLHHQVACLKEELVRREKEYNEKLSKNVSSAFKLVDRYRFFIAILVQSRFPVEPFLEAEAIALQTSGVDPAACSITDASHTSNPSRTSNPSADEEHTPGGAVEVLLRWCNHILAEATGPKNFVEVKSFGVDFATGEAFLAVLNHVHPELATIAPEEVNAEYRHRRIKDMCEKIGLLYSLDASDFIHRREDRIVMALSELFLNHISSKWQRCAAAASESMEHFQMTSTSRLEQEAEKGPLEVDEETFNSHMEDCISHLNDMEKEVATQTFYEKEITSNAISVALQERHLAVERRRGAPIPVVGRESSKPFWKLKNKHLSDLKEKVSKSDIDLWEPLINVSLPRALQQHVDTTSRLYSHYAGVNSKHMTEVGFWRFIDTTNAINDRLNKETVSTVFDRVASPQLELALKAASHGKSALDIQTLLRAARQEIDIRHISPSQFTEILVRLAINSYGAFQGMVGSVERYLEELKVSSPNDMPAMLQAFYEADCHAVTHFFCDDLSRVFFFYAKRQENSKNARERNIAMQDGGRFASLLSTRTLNYLLDDCGFISDTKEAVTLVMNNGPQPGRHFVSGDQLEQIVTVLQQRHSSMKVGEVPFTIFLESLAAISHYWCPDPLVPQSRKFAAFLCDMIRQLSIRHSNSTLLLGIPPNVTLEGGSKVDLVTS